MCLDSGARYAGGVTGFMNTFGNLGGFVGPAGPGLRGRTLGVVGALLHHRRGYQIGAVLGLVIDPHQRIDTAPTAAR